MRPIWSDGGTRTVHRVTTSARVTKTESMAGQPSTCSTLQPSALTVALARAGSSSDAGGSPALSSGIGSKGHWEVDEPVRQWERPPEENLAGRALSEVFRADGGSPVQQSAGADIVPIPQPTPESAAKIKQHLPAPRRLTLCRLQLLPIGDTTSRQCCLWRRGASLENECYPLVALRWRGTPSIMSTSSRRR